MQPSRGPLAAPPMLTRRAFLRGAATASLATALAACVPQAVPQPLSPRPPTPSPTTGPSTPVASVSPSPSGSSTATPAPADLERMVAGLIVVGFRGAQLDPSGWVARALGRGLAGVILFDRDQLTGRSRNVRSPRQVRELSAAIRSAAGRTPVIAIDQEGGLVTRLSPAYGFPAVASEAEVGAGSDAAARRWAKALAATLADAGITLNLAPVVDLDVNPTSPAIGALGRSFSANADVVVAKAGIEVEAHRAAGVATALKHFPGIGSSTGNTDNGVVDVTATWHRAELQPFRRLVEADRADVIMVGHVRNDTLDPDAPASLSRAVVTDLLRGTIGWQGPVITDDLQAGAVAAEGAGAAAVKALQAGVDLLLFANQQAYDPHIVGTVIDAVTAAVATGELDRSVVEAARSRVEALFPGA